MWSRERYTDRTPTFWRSAAGGARRWRSPLRHFWEPVGRDLLEFLGLGGALRSDEGGRRLPDEGLDPDRGRDVGRDEGLEEGLRSAEYDLGAEPDLTPEDRLDGRLAERGSGQSWEM